MPREAGNPIIESEGQKTIAFRFPEYEQMADEAEKQADEVCQIYNEVMPESQFNKEEVVGAILRKAKKSPPEAQAIMQALEEFGLIASEIKRSCEEIGEEEVRIKSDDYRKYLESEINRLEEKKSKQKRLSDADEEDYAVFMNELDLLDEPISEEERLILDEVSLARQYDSARILKTIELLKRMYTTDDPEKFLALHYPDREKTISNLKKSGEIKKQLDEPKYKPLVEKLEKLLQYRIRFEAKLEQIVYGQESVILPEEFTKNLPREIAEIRPERLPINTPVYFPVGISKELPEWEKVFEYDKKAAKPIDLYGYLFWLENQGRPVELVVCDEIQATNYALLYPSGREKNSPSNFRDLARKIGEREKENYQKIINAFGLKNIKIIDYREFVDKNKDQFDKYRGLCERLVKNPIFAESFLSMVQESIAQSMTLKEKEEFLPYAMEEVSWILSANGSKVSHINEARYDVLAAVIKNTEAYAEEHNIDIFDPQKETELAPIINGVLEGLRDRFSAIKSSSRKNNEVLKYYGKAEQILKKIRWTANVGIPADFFKKSVKFPFAVPQTGSQSFGWRSGGEKQEAVIKFREPYSTYFYKNGSELFLESDQVVAAEGHIAGKVLTMPAEVQKEYAERAVKPILIHYFKVLENSPEEYFEKIGKRREDLLFECQESQTLIDLLKFIQKYIVKSSS